MSNTDKNKKPVDAKEKEVLENIMEELEQEAKDKEKENAAAEPEKEATEEKAAETEENPKEETSDEKKKNLFGKKEKKNPLQDKVDELNDKYLRLMADYENFRKRNENEKAQQFEAGQGNVLGKLLPIVDNFERGLAAVPEEEKDSAFADGMNKIYKQLMTELDNLGVKPIEAKGQEFNPDLHNAVMQVENAELESGTVAEELQKGYTYHDMVVRHSMVSVVS